MDKATLDRIYRNLSDNVPKLYTGRERTAYLTALLDMAQMILNQIEIEQEAQK